eukprot:TRINITY_DN56334_c0_g1_i1.p1 TRINITY_DN56334_c0_g1~~TRINITY_DN56334_c0_g1_i1.p1  ORF type:complete len:582 (-),score=73.63 TRINITY_DN56334_c0_g1_i1:111-1856(-)
MAMGPGPRVAVPLLRVPAHPELDGATSFGGSTSSSSPTSTSAPTEYRLRFFNYNMGNSFDADTLDSIQGPGHRGPFAATVLEPFEDGKVADVVFCTFPETRTDLHDWSWSTVQSSDLDKLILLDSLVEGNADCSSLQGMLSDVAGAFKGNLKSALAFSSKHFVEDKTASVYGRLMEPKIAGVPLPNPKKAFLGRSFRDHVHQVRFSFIGAHFPIKKIAAILETSADPLEDSKLVMAHHLRAVLRTARLQGALGGDTILFLQGDLNSRTVLDRVGGCTDVLLEVLADDDLQTAMQYGLTIPKGRWREAVRYGECEHLPITYKFEEWIGRDFQRADGEARTRGYANQLTIGNLLAAAAEMETQIAPPPRARTSFQPTPFDHGGDTIPQRKVASTTVGFSAEDSDIYQKTLNQVPRELLERWGIKFKEVGLKPFHFPACADRVLYWASDELHSRITWSPQSGGYEVNHFQGGSDHRPVVMEAVLRIGPAKAPASLAVPPAAAGARIREKSPAGQHHQRPRHLVLSHKLRENDDDLDIVADRTAGSSATPRSGLQSVVGFLANGIAKGANYGFHRSARSPRSHRD